METKCNSVTAPVGNQNPYSVKTVTQQCKKIKIQTQGQQVLGPPKKKNIEKDFTVSSLKDATEMSQSSATNTLGKKNKKKGKPDKSSKRKPALPSDLPLSYSSFNH